MDVQAQGNVANASGFSELSSVPQIEVGSYQVGGSDRSETFKPLLLRHEYPSQKKVVRSNTGAGKELYLLKYPSLL